MNKEMFVSLLVIQDHFNEYLITNVYGKHPEGWKLNILQFGHYKIDGKTAPELYLKAKDNFEEGYLLDAVHNMILCSKTARPANEIWEYLNKKEMSEFYYSADKEINQKHPLPITLEMVDSHPQILSLYPQFTEEGYFPMIEYLTTISLEYTLKTKVENEKIQKEIARIFKGIDKDKKYILYTAYNEIPKDTGYVPIYRFVQKLE